MTATFLAAITAAALHRPEALLTVASDVRPCTTSLVDVVAAGQHMGTRMIAAGIAPGDIIGCMLPNWREWMVVAVGAAHAGAVMLPIVTIYGAQELGFILRQSGAKWLFTPDRFRNIDYPNVVADCGELPALERHIAIGPEFAALEGEGPISEPATVDPEDLALLVFTSGTTADPKGVMHSARGLLAELETMRIMRGGSDDDAVISPWPPGHVAGALSMYRYLCQGSPLVLMDQWDAALAAELVEQHHVTSSSGTPFHLSGMMAAAEANGRDLSSLRQYLVGAAPVPPSLIEACQRQGLAVYHCYGSSEHPTVTSGVVEDPLDKQLHTEGRAIIGSEMRFVDDDGNDVPPGEDGEICTRGPELFMGYLDPSLNEAAFLPGGWYRSGDIGRLDPEGFLLITDRKKDIIIRGGENISSKEVEAVLLRIDAVADAAVVAAPDERMGEVVRACIVLVPGASITLDEIRDHFAVAGIAKQKTPELLSIVDELPRNASGKVLKHELRNSL
jgi:acyl-CoA synthetase (AMP-forming)/AMP-acid ligase II